MFLDLRRRTSFPTQTLCCKNNYIINRKLVEILEKLSAKIKLSKDKTPKDEYRSDRHILKVV